MYMNLNTATRDKQSALALVKETASERKERIKYASAMSTKAIPDKSKVYSRKQKHKNQINGEYDD